MRASPVVGSVGLVVDTDTKLSLSECKALYTAGVRCVVRYVFFGSPRAGDIDAQELRNLTSSGITVVLIQHPREQKYNILTAATGSGDASWAVRNAVASGYDPKLVDPAGPRLALGLDMEGVISGGSSHAPTWCQYVDTAGFDPLVYLGFASGLTSSQCDSLPGSPVFWADAAALTARPQPTRGVSWHQHLPSSIAGVGVDVNTVLQDGAVVGIAA